jgi:hypothetical protein
MARKPQLKRKDGQSLSLPTVANDRLTYAALFKVSPTGEIKSGSAFAPFLLNPDMFEDTKGGNWSETIIPGQSDPVLQWVSGSARNLTFTALVTKDTTHFPEAQTDLLNVAVDAAIGAVGSIASAFAGVSIPPVGDIIASLLGDNKPGAGEELSVAPYLDYYRSLLYPSIDEEKILQASPPLVVLAMGKTLSSFTGKNATGTISPATDLWVAKNVSVKITKWLPNLTPMEAEVTFQLTQYIVSSISASSFDPDSAMGPPLPGSAQGFFGL